MDYTTKIKIKKFLTMYLEGNEEIIIKLSEINKEYAELFPLIKETSINVFGSALSKLEKDYEELEKECIKYKDIENELNEIIKKYKRIGENKEKLGKNKRGLSNLLNKE